MEETNKAFWDHHSLAFLEMAFYAGNQERLSKPDGVGERHGDCGDTVRFFIKVQGSMLTQASFEVEGCLNTIACCNTVVKLATGKTLDACWQMEPDRVIDHLETLPKEHYHCAELSLGAFYRALADYCQKKKRPLPDETPT